MADWAEVRRLAADFQRLQASSTAHKLSERNCVELVAKLVERGLLEVVYTLDGKEYVTPEQLEREIRNELSAHGGRINVVDLQQLLNVDLSHVESRVAEVLKHDHSLTLLNGELIERSYMQRLCEEINDTVQEAGQASVADLSRNFGLPNNFLIEHIEAALGGRINGHLDKSYTGIIYTESYVNRYHSRIRGRFHALTQPTAVSTIISQGTFQEKLFNTVLHELISSEQLAGSLRGRMERAVYIPYIYTNNQNKWADSFLAANGYLEYDALTRLGIDDPREYISHRYCGESSSGELVQLSTCCVGSAVVARVEGALEEMFGSGDWVDVMPLLPSPCTPSDAELLLHHVGSSQPDLQLFSSVATTRKFLRSCCDHFKPLITERAQKAAAGGVSALPQKSNEGEKIGGGRKKGGGGGRKGGRGKARGQEDTFKKSTWEHKFMTSDEVANVLADKFPDCPEDFLFDIATSIQSSLQDSFLEETKECVSALSQGSSASQRRKQHADLQERVQGLWNMLHLFEKAISLFEGDTAVQLSRCLLRTLCSNLFNIVLTYLADDNRVTLPSESEMTAKERTKVISALPTSMKNRLSAVNSTLIGKEVVAFFEQLEGLCAEDYCGVMLKKLDKKKERACIMDQRCHTFSFGHNTSSVWCIMRQLMFSHQQLLLENLRREWEPSMVLHLVIVILFQQNTNCALHISGKLVPQVIEFLRGRIHSDQYAKLSAFEQLVIQQRRLSTQPTKARSEKTGAMGREDNEGMLTEEKVTEIKGEEPSDMQATASEAIGGVEGTEDTAHVDQELQSLLNSLKQLVVKPKEITAAE